MFGVGDGGVTITRTKTGTDVHAGFGGEPPKLVFDLVGSGDHQGVQLVDGLGTGLEGLSNRLCEGVSSYVKLGAVFGGWRWVQMRSEIRRLRTRIASLWVFPRVMSFW